MFTKKTEVEEKDIEVAENKAGIQVIITENRIKVKEGDRFVEGKKKPNFGQKRKMKNFMNPKKMTVQGGVNAEEKPITMEIDDYSYNKDLDLYILDKMLTDWSKKEKLTWSNILEDEEVYDLMERFAEEFKKANDLDKKKNTDEEEKKF